MLTVCVEREVAIPTAKLWATLADFGNMNWAPGIERMEVIGAGPGMIRRIFMPDMPPIDEVLEAIDHDALRYSYTIPEGIPLPISDYRAEVQLTALPGEHTRIRWSCTGTPAGASAEDVGKIMEGAYGQMIGWLVKALG